MLPEEYTQLMREAHETLRALEAIQGKRLALVVLDEDKRVVTIDKALLDPVYQQLVINAKARINELRIKGRQTDD